MNIKNIPSKSDLLIIDALLFAVYKIEPKEIRKMKLSEIDKKLKTAKRDMTWGNAYLFTSLIESKPKTLWQRIISKIKN